MTSRFEPTGGRGSGLADVVEMVLDKGLIINADITVSVAGVELLGIKIRAALASFETAARYGLEFPSGVNYANAVWKESEVIKETCPQCGKRVAIDELLNDQCPWCGWKSARAEQLKLRATPVLENAYQSDAEGRHVK